MDTMPDDRHFNAATLYLQSRRVTMRPVPGGVRVNLQTERDGEWLDRVGVTRATAEEGIEALGELVDALDEKDPTWERGAE
jgi:hypothetical protein